MVCVLEIQSSFSCSHLHWPRGAITQSTNCVTFYLLTQLLISTKKTCTSQVFYHTCTNSFQRCEFSISESLITHSVYSIQGAPSCPPPPPPAPDPSDWGIWASPPGEQPGLLSRMTTPGTTSARLSRKAHFLVPLPQDLPCQQNFAPTFCLV